MDRPNPIRQQEEAVTRLLKNVPLSTLGDRLRRSRLRQGRSIREIAEMAGVSKTSVVRLEQGKGTYPITVVKVCSALGLHLVGLTERGDSQSAQAAVHYHQDDRWFDMTDFGAGPLGGYERPLSDAERADFAADGVAVPLLYLRSRLPEGRLLPALLEIFGPSETRSHPGEEMVYVLKGRAEIQIGEETFFLDAGESITFYSAEPHRYSPAPDLPPDELPVRLLSIRMDEHVKRPSKAVPV